MNIFKILLYFILPFVAIPLQGQKYEISGIVTNETNNYPLANANIILCRANDSILVKFTRTAANGRFKLNDIPNGSYLLKVNYPTALEYLDSISINNNRVLDTIKIINDLVSLQTILITRYNSGLRINGDTTEYVADFFRTNPGATVEDLLKKLPGIQVNKSGEITAQGKKVEKILVDGEEFFPDDPSIATKYLRADMIDKIQVYDEKKDTLLSDNDENKTHTMNLTLKEDKKRGQFGRLEAGSDLQKYINGGVFAGHFNKSLKIAGFGKTSNFENGALNWQDRNQFGGAATSGSTTNMAGGMMYTSRSQSFNDDIDNRGIPNSTSIGLVLSDAINKKWKYNASYRFANEGNNGIINKNSTYFLPDSGFSIAENTENNSNQNGHRLNASFTFEPDSLTRISVNNSAGYLQNNSSSNSISQTSSTGLLNDNNRKIENDFTRIFYSGNLAASRQLNAAGRAINANYSYTYNPTVQNKDFTSTSNYYNEKGLVQGVQDLLQHYDMDVSLNTMAAGIGFINPINKKLSFYTNYNYDFQKDENNTKAYNQKGGLNELILPQSSHYSLSQNKHRLGGSVFYKTKKTNFSAGVSGSYLQLSQSNYFTNQNTKVAFTNLLPSAGIQYSWKKQKNLNLNYSATNRAPQIAFMQPITNNNDPLNITEGNPNLTQSITHSISTSINSFQVLKGRYLWGYANFSLPKNAFVQASWLDSNAVRRVMTVNANGNYSASGSFNYSHKVKKLPLSLDVSSSVNYSNNITYINAVEVTTKSKSLSSSAGISFELETIELNLEYQVTYSQNNSTLSNQNGNSFITHMPNYDVEIQLPKKLIFTTEGNFNIRPKTNVFAQRNVYLMSAGLIKQFGKKNNFEMGLDIHDMLNQNIGFNRDISTNLVVDETYTQLSRYWLLKLKWNFSEAGGGRD